MSKQQLNNGTVLDLPAGIKMSGDGSLSLTLPKKHEATAIERPAPSEPMFSGVNVEALLSKAVDSKAAVEVIKELNQLRLQMKAEQAQEQFDEAMSAFQAECPPIMKEKGVKTNAGALAYKFAPIEAIEAQIRPLLRRFGFSHTFDTDTASANGWVIAKCIVTHKAGHSRVSTAKFPLGTKTQIMSDTQVYAAALTFANRRALQNAYGLVLSGEDIDGATGKLKPAGPSKTAPDKASLKPLTDEIWRLLTPEVGDGPANWDSRHQWLWDRDILDPAVPETVQSLHADRLQKVIAQIKEGI